MSLSLLVLFLMAQTVTLWHAEIHAFHEYDELCETFDSLEKLPVIIDTPSALIKLASPANHSPVFFPRKCVQALIPAYNSRAPPI